MNNLIEPTRLGSFILPKIFELGEKNMNLNKLENETSWQYVKRLTENRREMDLDYSEWAKLICDYECSSDNARKGHYLVSRLIDKLDEEMTQQIINIQPQQMQDELLMELEMKKD